MLGAVIGDIVGSNFEFENNRSPYFIFLRDEAFFTDETVIMAAIINLLKSDKVLTPDIISDELRIWMLSNSQRVPGAIFMRWCYNNKNEAYNSTGNQSLVRTIPIVKWAVNKKMSLSETLAIVMNFVVVTHNSPDAIKASRIYANILYNLLTKQEIFLDDDEKAKEMLISIYSSLGGEMLSDSIYELRKHIIYNVNSIFALQVMMTAILESDDFSQALKSVVSIGGDSDTLCAITGAVAEIVWGCEEYIPKLDAYFIPQNVEILNIIKSLY